MIVEKVNLFYAQRSLSSQEEFRIRPSNVGDCRRLTAHMLAGTEREPLSAETSRVFEHGHARGARLEEIARDIWPDAVTQMPIQVPVPWGLMPGTVDLWIPSEKILVDWKTVSVFGFANLEKEGVSEQYQLQVTAYRKGVYAACVAAGAGFAVEEIRTFLVYEAKDSDARKGVKAGALKEREVVYDEVLQVKYLARLEALAEIEKAKREGTLDPFAVPGLPKGSWKCKVDENQRPKYCSIGPVRGRCHS